MNVTEIKAAVKGLVEMMNKQGENKDVSKLANVDVSAVQEQVNRQWTFEVWDKKSPINGRDASFILEHKKDEIPTNGEVYLLKQGDQVVYFQPHHPEAAGYVAMTKADVEGLAMKHLQSAVDNAVVQTIANML